MVGAVANQHVMISHQHVEATSTTKQEAKRKQKALDILASARRIGFEINHRTCSTTKHPNLFDHQTSKLVRPPNTELVRPPNIRTCSTTKHPNLFDHQTPNLFDGCHRLPLPRKVYIAGHFGLISLSPLMYYFTFIQATRYIVIHTRDSNSQHHQRNSYTISLG
jgi:hypothetical protein